MLSKEASSTIFLVFGMTRLGIEPQYPGPLVNILPIRPMDSNITSIQFFYGGTFYGIVINMLDFILSEHFILLHL